MIGPRWKNEKAFQASVIEAGKQLGWFAYHTYNSFRSTPGFPDLVLVRERVIFAELKMPKGKVTAAQQVWRERLETAAAEYYLWRPEDWDQILIILQS